MMGSNAPSYITTSLGCRLSVLFTEEFFQFAKNYEPIEGEIFLVSYPKCGNTWTMQIVYLLMHGGESVPEGKKLFEEIPFLEWDKPAVEAQTRPRVLKSHNRPEWLTINDKAKYIVVIRNPKDCCVSFYHHTKAFEDDYHFTDGKFEDFFEFFLSGEVDWNDFADWYLSWIENRGKPNFLFLHYEDMKADTEDAIRKIAEFLGGKAQELIQKDGMMEQILEKSSFGYMKKREKAMQIPVTQNAFFRKGAIGDWKNWFTEDQSKRMDQKILEKMGHLDFVQKWKDWGVIG